MDEANRAWEDVGESFARLGRAISDRYRRMGEQEPSGDASRDEGAVADAMRRATDELDRAFTALGDTLRDDEGRRHVRDAGRKLADALEVTVTAVGNEVRRAVAGHDSSPADEPPRPTAPPEPPS